MSEEYANLEVNRVILHANASAYTNADAVPKSYVDQVKSDILGGNDISQALDTLKEIGAYLVDTVSSSSYMISLVELPLRRLIEQTQSKTNKKEPQMKKVYWIPV